MCDSNEAYIWLVLFEIDLDTSWNPHPSLHQHRVSVNHTFFVSLSLSLNKFSNKKKYNNNINKIFVHLSWLEVFFFLLFYAYEMKEFILIAIEPEAPSIATKINLNLFPLLWL